MHISDELHSINTQIGFLKSILRAITKFPLVNTRISQPLFYTLLQNHVHFLFEEKARCLILERSQLEAKRCLLK